MEQSLRSQIFQTDTEWILGYYLLRLVSGIIGILGIAVLVTYSPKNGLILLTIAFLFSPMGLPMIAVWILSVLQGMSGMLKSI